MTNIYSMTRVQLEDYFERIGEKRFKATQVFEWLYKKRVHSFDEIGNIRKSVLEQLSKDYCLEQLVLVQEQKDEDVSKFLFELPDGKTIESVLMFHDYGNSLCISTQVGCNMGCTFCESGRLKKVRNLETFEMVLQILQVEEILKLRISHVVLMGIGEPFDNYDHVMDFVDIVNDGKGIDLGARHITISTCGLVPRIRDFMKHGKQVNLAISLHAPNDELRTQIMPINRAYPLRDVMDVVREYVNVTHRRVTFEYILLKDVNDHEKEALELASLLRGLQCYVNLIPYNETSHIIYQKSKKDSIMRFYDILKKQHINVTIRREFGSRVSAACGQLRANYEEEK